MRVRIRGGEKLVFKKFLRMHKWMILRGIYLHKTETRLWTFKRYPVIFTMKSLMLQYFSWTCKLASDLLCEKKKKQDKSSVKYFAQKHTFTQFNKFLERVTSWTEFKSKCSIMHRLKEKKFCKISSICIESFPETFR